MPLQILLIHFLMYVLVPVWLVAGVADWLCHRESQIEKTSGLKESLLHAVQFAEVGLPLLAVLILEVNAAVLLFMILGTVLHQATAIWDVRYANAKRRVSPMEQHVHGVLEATPVVATAVVVMLHWSDFRSLLALEGVAFSLELKHSPLAGWYLLAVVLAVGFFGVLPYGEELVRTWRTSPPVRKPITPRNS